MDTKALIQQIIDQEWQFFQATQNMGGRASCQDEPETFAIMRSSQFAGWSEATLQSYLGDLEKARLAGRNLVSEKYARMMASTHPDEFRALEDSLPPLTAAAKKLVEAIVQLNLVWEEECDRRYPHVRSQGRPLRTCQDAPGITSFETYLRGELCTYSEPTLALLLRDLEACRAGGRNVAIETLDRMAQAYGHASAEALEKRKAGSCRA